MKKDTHYFSHDYNSRNDEKIKKLMFKHGLLGYGIYWALIEELYQNNNSIELNFELLAYDFRIDEDLIKSIVENFNLFIIENNRFSCSSIAKRLEKRDEINSKYKEAGKKGGQQTQAKKQALLQQEPSNAVAMLKQEPSIGKAIKEKKRKENKTIINLTEEEQKEENWLFVEENWSTSESFTHNLKSDWFEIPLSEQTNIIELIKLNPKFFKPTKFWKRNFLQQAKGSYQWLYDKVQAEAVKQTSLGGLNLVDMNEFYKDL